MSSSQADSNRPKRKSTSASATKSTTKTKSTKSTGPYDRAFEQNLIDGGVYPDEYEYPDDGGVNPDEYNSDGQVPPRPENWEEINQRLGQPRLSLSPSQFPDAEFRRFKRTNAHAFKEQQISNSVIPIIQGKIKDAKCVSGGVPFANLDHLTDGTLKPGNPDLYYGARPEQLDRRVRTQISKRIIPTTEEHLPIVPNFFLAVKGRNGTAAVAERQACYDGALGARGMHSLQSYRQDESIYDNKAYVITSIYSDGQLRLYTSHPIEPSDGRSRPEYVMTQLNTWGMTGNSETFRQGAKAFRNAVDWAKDQRDEAIRLANVRAGMVQTATHVSRSRRYSVYWHT